MSQSLQQLKMRVTRISRLGQAAALLGWDQQTYMPSGAAESRGEQAATLSELIHEFATSEEMGNLLAQSEADTQGQDDDSDDPEDRPLEQRWAFVLFVAVIVFRFIIGLLLRRFALLR